VRRRPRIVRASGKEPGDIGRGRILARKRLMRLELEVFRKHQRIGNIRIAQCTIQFEGLLLRLLLRERIRTKRL
jgi:hypothetical protein